MKRTLCLLLCLLMAGSLLASCGGGEAETQPAETTPEAQNTENTDTETAEETESFDPGLPDTSFDGRTFTFLTKGTEAFT